MDSVLPETRQLLEYMCSKHIRPWDVETHSLNWRMMANPMLHITMRTEMSARTSTVLRQVL